MKNLLTTCGLGLFSMTIACGTPEEVQPFEDPEDPVDPVVAGAIEKSLGEFESKPAEFMDRIPQKDTPMANPFFTADVVSARGYVGAKDVFREENKGLLPKEDAPGSNDQARNLVDELRYTKLGEMYRYKKATLAESPWSDDYWALYTASIAKRYADPSITLTENWQTNVNKLKAASQANLDVLSPAEKYDLLVGDASKTMTNYNWNVGKQYFDAYGKVETWMGICHGWAPAAFMVPRPQKTIEVKAADGRMIKFFPSDIKALASLLWAGGRSQTRFIGGRCNVKDPAKDAIGRIKDPACRDTNAGTWHLAVVNQIGVARRSMVLDATFDYEVWNQPIYAYDYAYFNPKTNKVSSTLAGARVAVASFPEDKFKQYRAPGTTHIVGIAMNVKWVVETHPSHAPTDSPEKDAISGARYLYTLELDSEGNIIGGEWLQNAHPDFLWVPPRGARASAPNDYQVSGSWDGSAPMPASWRQAAVSSSRYGVPLAAIVTRLAELARP